MFADLAQDAAGNADGDDVRGNIPRDDRARADHRIIADGHAGQNDRARAEPYVFSDMHVRVVLDPALPQSGGKGCVPVTMVTLGPIIVLSPMKICPSSTSVR